MNLCDRIKENHSNYVNVKIRSYVYVEKRTLFLLTCCLSFWVCVCICVAIMTRLRTDIRS